MSSPDLTLDAILFPAHRRGFTAIEVLVILGVLAALLLFVVYPRLGRRAPICSFGSVCASNLSILGKAMKIYANDYGDTWPLPAFDESRAGQIDYRVRPGGGEGSSWSPSRAEPSSGIVDGARRLSTTRAFWMLVRSGDIMPKGFICPTSGDTPDPTTNIDAYCDFTGPNHVSYGYQVPFGPPKTRAGEWIDANVPLAADKGPYSDPTVAVPPKTATTQPTGPDFLASWRPFNSRNHQGEGQNVLYADGHVSFERLPTVGVDGDNIFTVALDTPEPWGRIAGESPWARSAPPLLRFDPAGRLLPTTDSVIFP